MKNIQISSPETDRKIARPGSIIFMCAAWLFMAGLLSWIICQWHDWAMFLDVWLDILFALFLVPLVLIPIQVVRYFRQK